MVKAMVAQSFWPIGLVGLAIGLNACGQKTAKPASEQAAVVQTENSAAGQSQTLPVPPNGQAFLPPTLPQVQPEQMPKLSIQGLQPATKPESRLSQLSKLTTPQNARDPFAMLHPGISVTPSIGGFKPVIVPKGQSVKPAKVAKAPPAKTPVKMAKRPPRFLPVGSLPTPMPTPMPIQATPVASMPVLPVAAPVMPAPVVEPGEMAAVPLPPASPTSLAEQVEISGVVQMGGKNMVIAKAGNENSARYLQTGDALAGGQVVIKSIRVSPIGDPIVILEQNGVEITKSVGSAPRVAAIR